MSIKNLYIIILILYPILSYTQNNDTIYTYIENFTISNPDDFSEKYSERIIIENNFIAISSQRFNSTFMKRTEDLCNNQYIIIDVENEDEAIKHRKKNRRNSQAIATADKYMQGYIRKRTSDYEITVVVKKFDNTLETFTVYENLELENNTDGDVINNCLDSLAIKVSNILCPRCRGQVKSIKGNPESIKKIKKLAKLVYEYNPSNDKMKIKIENKIDELQNSSDLSELSVSSQSLIGLWFLNVKNNKSKALDCFRNAISLYCEGTSLDDDNLIKQITNKADVKIWLNSKMNECK